LYLLNLSSVALLRIARLVAGRRGRCRSFCTSRIDEFLNSLPVAQLAFPVLLKSGAIAVSF